MTRIDDHPLRYDLANELHARPFPSVEAPGTALFLALKRCENAAGRDRQADLDHLIALLDRHGAPHPKPGATHYFGPVGRHMLKWESHTEVVTYTAFAPTLAPRPFDPADFEVFPDDWLQSAPGARITSANLRIAPWNDKDEVIDCLRDWFVPESLAVARVLDDAAVMAGDFRIDPAGHLRFAVFVAPHTGARRIGRIVQRLCEIETYKAMSMLGFARAQNMAPRLNDFATELSALIGDMAEENRPAEDTLTRLLDASAGLEDLGSQSDFRFAATAAYENIVHERIEVLREERFEGRQTFSEFMMRRYDPAMRTVKSAERRLNALTLRATRTGELLRTRVDVERSGQNQKLLENMDRRADLQLRLQETVEGLSVMAISYYAVSLAAYLLAPLSGVLGISKAALTAGLVLPVVLVVWLLIRRIRSRMH